MVNPSIRTISSRRLVTSLVDIVQSTCTCKQRNIYWSLSLDPFHFSTNTDTGDHHLPLPRPDLLFDGKRVVGGAVVVDSVFVVLDGVVVSG